MMRKEARFLSLILFTISTSMIAVSAAVFLQHAEAASNGKATPCKYHLSDFSKCLQKDRPFILPFP
jgi:hypothetical protein